jgi:hypothetical protein
MSLDLECRDLLIMLNVVMLSDFMLNVVMLSDVMLSDIILSDVMLSDVMLIVIMLSDVMLNVVMLSDVVLNIVVKWRYAECRYVECRHAECRGTKNTTTFHLHTPSLNYTAKKFYNVCRRPLRFSRSLSTTPIRRRRRFVDVESSVGHRQQNRRRRRPGVNPIKLFFRHSPRGKIS